MTQTVAKLGVDLVANDKTAKGFASVEKRAGKVGASAASKMGEAERAAGKLGGFRGAAQTFLEVDKAASKAFGTGSALGRLSGRVSDFRAIGSAIGSGFGRASVSMNAARATGDAAAQAGESAAASLGKAAIAGEAAAGGIAAAGAEAATLGAALGPVGIGLAALVAIGGAAAYAGYKMASGWSYGAAAVGRLSDRIGIAVEDIQKLQLAGERFGIDRGATGGALAGFARTANDAYNARNPEAFVLMRMLGMQFRKKADGTLDYNAMLQDAARGIQAQKDPVIQAEAAERLGLGEMLPLLRQGPDAVRRETDDAGAHGAVASGADIDKARRFVHDSTAIGQLGERQRMRAGVAATGVALPVLGAALGAGQSLTDAAEDPAKRAAMLGAGARKVGGVAEKALSTVANALIPPAEAIGQAGAGMARAADKQDRAGSKMLQAAQSFSAAGLTGAAAKHLNPGNMRPVGGDGFVHYSTVEAGLTAMGRQIVRDQRVHGARNIEELIAGRVGSNGKRAWGWAPASDHNDTPAYVRNVAQRLGIGSRDAINFSDPAILTQLIMAIIKQENGRNYFAEKDVRGVVDASVIPVKVDVHLHGAPAGSKAVVTAGRRSSPAISHAMQH